MADDMIPSLGDVMGKSDKRLTYERLLALYVGQGSDFYVDLDWERVEKGKSVSWNWLAFFLPTIWLLYRKFWGWAAFLIALPLVAVFAIAGVAGDKIAPHQIDLIVFFLVAPFNIFFALRGHFLYLDRAKIDIRKIAKSRMKSSDAKQKLKNKGGISWTGIGIGLVLLILPYVIA